jgi:hypothetical protein
LQWVWWWCGRRDLIFSLLHSGRWAAKRIRAGFILRWAGITVVVMVVVVVIELSSRNAWAASRTAVFTRVSQQWVQMREHHIQ